MFDYEILNKCTYPIQDTSPDGAHDCGDPAIYHVWFWDDEGNDAGDMNVCAEHFNKISATSKGE